MMKNRSTREILSMFLAVILAFTTGVGYQYAKDHRDLAPSTPSPTTTTTVTNRNPAPVEEGKKNPYDPQPENLSASPYSGSYYNVVRLSALFSRFDFGDSPYWYVTYWHEVAGDGHVGGATIYDREVDDWSEADWYNAISTPIDSYKLDNDREIIAGQISFRYGEAMYVAEDSDADGRIDRIFQESGDLELTGLSEQKFASAAQVVIYFNDHSADATRMSNEQPIVVITARGLRNEPTPPAPAVTAGLNTSDTFCPTSTTTETLTPIAPVHPTPATAKETSVPSIPAHPIPESVKTDPA